jgi:hypothetical protein
MAYLLFASPVRNHHISEGFTLLGNTWLYLSFRRQRNILHGPPYSFRLEVLLSVAALPARLWRGKQDSNLYSTVFGFAIKRVLTGAITPTLRVLAVLLLLISVYQFRHSPNSPGTTTLKRCPRLLICQPCAACAVFLVHVNTCDDVILMDDVSKV